VRIGGATVSLEPLLGCPFGSSFELVEGALVRASAQPPAPLATDVQADERSNKALLDDGSAQARAAPQPRAALSRRRRYLRPRSGV